MHVFGEPCVAEGGTGLIVADHQAGVVSVGQRDPVYGAEATDLGEQGKRVVPGMGSPRFQRGSHHLAAVSS